MTHEQFTQIYLPFSGKMYALAYNLLRNRDEARDCVQDVYAELWKKRDTIEPDKPPLPQAKEGSNGMRFEGVLEKLQ
jgi:DNA-directed RNA polymerase specialized sigma24 family protein